jgi:hypothetical protein
MARTKPDFFYAYVGTGPVTDETKNYAAAQGLVRVLKVSILPCPNYRFCRAHVVVVVVNADYDYMLNS